MTKDQKTKFILKYNNPWEQKINEMNDKIDEAVRLAKQIDEQDGFNTFPGWKFFKFRNKT